MQRFKTDALRCLLTITLLFIIKSDSFAGEILVSAAISLKDAFGEIVKDFEKEYPGEKVFLNFASSGQLQKQIEEGANVDLFASASTKEMDSLESKGLIISRTRRIFAENSLIIISHKKIDNITSLLKDDFENIAIGNPVTVPAGKYAKDTLNYYNIYDKMKDRLVFAENARQVLDYVLRGAADAGIVYNTDAYSVRDGSLYIFGIDEKSHEKIMYPVAVVSGTKNEDISKRFINIIMSEKALSILKSYGFLRH
jgi:molybdate transport system substrate-binding protein